MVTALLFLVVLMCQTVLAAQTLNPARVLYELQNGESNIPSDHGNYDGIDYGVEYDSQNKTWQRITKIGEKVNGQLTRLEDYYCAYKSIGFQDRDDSDKEQGETDYDDKYTMKYDMSNSADKSAILGFRVNGNPMYTEEQYKKILALADLFYVGDDIDFYVSNVLNPAYAQDEVFSANEFDYADFKSINAEITVDQIRAVQQLVLWDFTNNYVSLANSVGDDFLCYKDGTGIHSLRNSGEVVDQDNNKSGYWQNEQAKALYRYLKTTATSNANNTLHSTNVYLYTNPDQVNSTQPVIEIVPNIKFDLALRKFITDIKDGNGNSVSTFTNQMKQDRDPNRGIDGTSVEGEETTATKQHAKTPVEVEKGFHVIYTIRIYNEGNIKGTATKITDHLPAGLDFVPATESTINRDNGWKVDATDATGKTIYTEKLAGEEITPCDGKENFASLTGASYYRDVQIECKVNDNATSATLLNVAEITEDNAPSGIKDIDSHPGEETPSNDEYTKIGNTSDGKGYEDDDDYERLKLKEFDLALRKYITKVTRTENGEETTVKSNEDLKGRNPNVDGKIDPSTIPNTATYKHRKDPVAVKPGDFVYYNLTVYNEGDVKGHATKITDKLPAGLEFVEVVSGNFTKNATESTGNLLVLDRNNNNNPLAAYVIGQDNIANETVTIKCRVLEPAEGDDYEKILTNIAWISKYYNAERTVEVDVDRDSKTTDFPQEDRLVTPADEKGYLGNEENRNKDWADSSEYFKGEEDDDDFEKIVIYKGPTIHKGVKDVRNQDSGYDDGVNEEEDLHKWVINSTIPSNIADYKKYIIVDNIDYRLVYEGTKKPVEVRIINNDRDNRRVIAELSEDDYELTYEDNSSDKYSGTLTVKLLEKGNSQLTKIKEYGGYTVEVVFYTSFAKDENGKILAEIIGKEIPNQATLEYENESGEEDSEDSEIPEVHTGGITLLKYTNKDNEKVGLKDAEFKVYRTEEDARAKRNALKTVKSDKNGLVKFVGLEYGEDAMDNPDANKTDEGTFDHDSTKLSTDYWIVETKAPLGYKTITEPIKVTINNSSYEEDIEVLIREESSKDNPTRLVENIPEEFDLALRKFITDVNGKAPEVSREPVVDTTKLADGSSTTATYTHPKDPIMVVNGYLVTYTLRIYNEGDRAGYASIITDDIPEGLQFVPQDELNKEYRWVMYKEIKNESEANGKEVVKCKVKENETERLFVETEDASEAAIIRTDYLSPEQGESRMKDGDTENPNLIAPFDHEKGLDYRDIKAKFIVTEPNGSKRILTNYAQISEDKDEEGEDVDDRDSTPNVWNEGEDDQDIENLKVPDFDLALRKWVTQAIVIENGKEEVTNTGHDAWDDPEDIVKVELHRRNLNNVTVKFRYSIRVYNQGEIDGYVKEITDYIPEGLKFLPEDNPDWVDEGNNVISTRKLEGTLLKAGEGYADVEVLLTWINSKDNLGLKVNTAEISEDYNEWGVPDNDSTPDNRVPGEDDIDDAPVMLSISTGSEVTYYALGLGILVVIAGGIFLIKKYVL